MKSTESAFCEDNQDWNFYRDLLKDGLDTDFIKLFKQLSEHFGYYIWVDCLRCQTTIPAPPSIPVKLRICPLCEGKPPYKRPTSEELLNTSVFHKLWPHLFNKNSDYIG